MPSLTKVQTGFVEAQGALPLSSGTAAAPGLKFDDHAGTGMFSPSTGEIAFSTSNHSQAVTFKTDGKIGIGTDNPGAKLHTYGGDVIMENVGGIIFKLRRDDTSTAAERNLGSIEFQGNDSSGTYETGAEIRARSDFGHSDGDKPTRLEFLTTPDNSATPVERLRITSAGNLGIKTTSPNNTLTVGDGVQTSYAPSTAGNYVEIARTSGADAGLLINKNTGQWLVGIDNSDGANAPLRFEYAAAGSAHPGFGAGTLGMIIKHDGNVGIGTDTPQNNAQATIYKTGGNTPLYLKTDNTNSYLYFQDSGTTTFKCAVGSSSNQLKFVTDGSERLRINSDGTIRLKSDGSAANKARFEINEKWNNNATDFGIDFKRTYDVGGDDQDAGFIHVKRNGGSSQIGMSFGIGNKDAVSEKLLITSGGKIGIGTDNPVFELDLRQTGQADLLIGSYNAGGARLMLDGDSNGDGSGGDFCEIVADTSGDLTINARNPASDAELIFKTGAGTERLRITSAGNLDVTGGGNIIINEDSKLYFEGDADDDLNAIWKGDTENTLFLTSRYNIANIIDSNNDDTDSFWSVRHNATTLAGSGELMRVQSDGKIGMGGITSPGALLHLRDSSNTTQGNSQLKISKGVGGGAAPTSPSRANCYIHLGGSEWGSGGNGQYLMGFGYTNGETGTGIPAYIGFKETSSGGYTVGDLVFGTRDNSTGTNNATERLRILSNGQTYVKGTSSTNYPLRVGGGYYVVDKTLSSDRNGTAGTDLYLRGFSAGKFSYYIGVYMGVNHPSLGQRYMYFDIPSSTVTNENFIIEIGAAGWSYGNINGYARYMVTNHRNNLEVVELYRKNYTGFPHLIKFVNQSNTLNRLGIDANGGTSNSISIRLFTTSNSLQNILNNTIYFTSTNPF